MNKEKTSELIRCARLEKGLTQEKLGDLIGVTNKAVSRWENGESFPDVDLLDGLSSALDLRIEELVVGERRKPVGEEELGAIVKEIRLQLAQRKRQNLLCVVGVVIIGLLALFAYLSFTGKAISWSPLSWAIALGFSAISVSALNTSFCKNKKSRSVKLLIYISMAMGLYCIALVLLTAMLVAKGITPLYMDINLIGPFLKYQLIAICLVNILLTALSILKAIREEENTANLVIVSEAVAVLSMGYGSIISGVSVFEHRQIQLLIAHTASIVLTMALILTVNGITKKAMRNQDK